jgi:kinesin family protein 18/19
MEVFQNTTQFLCDGIIDGYNSAVFSYGTTGTGKTHTMIGPIDKADPNDKTRNVKSSDPGIMFNAMDYIFKLF